MHPSIDIFFSVAFFVALLGMIVSCLLFFRNYEGSFPARLLAGYLFSVSVISLFSAAYHTDIFLRYPHLARSMVFLSMCPSTGVWVAKDRSSAVHPCPTLYGEYDPVLPDAMGGKACTH
jgi:hypothetical protein